MEGKTMKAYEYILSKQTQFALNNKIKLVGSKGVRDRLAYYTGSPLLSMKNQRFHCYRKNLAGHQGLSDIDPVAFFEFQLVE